MTSPIYTALFDAISDAIESAYYDDTTTIHDYAHAATEAAMKACGPRDLVWHKSNINGWNGDYHTLMTAYTIRCADENGWKWYCLGRGAFGYGYSPSAAKAAAQSHADAAHWYNTVIGSETT